MMTVFSSSFTETGQTGKLLQGDAHKILRNLQEGSVDLALTSPPYCIGKEYDKYIDPDDFRDEISRVAKRLLRTIKVGGSMCWQIGYHVRRNEIVPLDFLVHEIMRKYPEFKLRNRIAWTFGHGAHSTQRLSGRHETILWYTKGPEYYFDLDSIRIEQKYPGKRSYKGPKKGEFSGNPLGKNPGDVWEIPNVKAQHVEKTAHPCQFPIALARRLIRALSPSNGIVLDPYVGSGSTVAAALLEKRNAIGIDLDKGYLEIAKSRLESLINGSLAYRDDVPILDPALAGSVSVRPAHFRKFEVNDG
jgi:adenine-specific DNA-methyltransferase